MIRVSEWVWERERKGKPLWSWCVGGIGFIIAYNSTFAQLGCRNGQYIRNLGYHLEQLRHFDIMTAIRRKGEWLRCEIFSESYKSMWLIAITYMVQNITLLICHHENLLRTISPTPKECLSVPNAQLPSQVYRASQLPQSENGVIYNWGEHERVLTLMMSMALVSVSLSVCPTTYILLFAQAWNHMTCIWSWTLQRKTTGTGQTCQRNSWRETETEARSHTLRTLLHSVHFEQYQICTC